MSINIKKTLSRDQLKVWYYLEWGRSVGQRRATGIFTWVKPKNQTEKNHNKEALAILETKRSQLILDSQAVNSTYIPQHKIKANFLDYYAEFVRSNRIGTNRHLESSLTIFKRFIEKDFVSAIEINETLCERFRTYLLSNFNGETPAGYFLRFKRVLKAAAKDGYFQISPAEDVSAKTSPVKKIKEILSEQEYIDLMNTPCTNYEVKKAFVFSLYTGLRWADVKPLNWTNVKEHSIVIVQNKTNVALEVPLHEIALNLLGEKKSGPVFYLPTLDGANKVLKNGALMQD